MNTKTVLKMLLGLLAAVVLFHLSILLKLLPYEFTWGGRLKNDTEMYVFETLSILIILFLVVLLLIKGKYVKEIIPLKVVHAILWVFVVLFGVNTLGNLLAETNFEKFFALVTLALALLLWIILTKDNKRKPNRFH